MELKIGKPKLAFIGYVMGAIVSLAMHFLIEYRQLPFLKGQTVFSGGKDVPTEEFVKLISPMFLYITPVFIVVGVINYLILKRRQ